jgi:hypothetical protein
MPMTLVTELWIDALVAMAYAVDSTFGWFGG